jgi:hypothetical protein
MSASSEYTDAEIERSQRNIALILGIESDEAKLDRLEAKLNAMTEERDRLTADRIASLEALVAKLTAKNKRLRDALDECLEYFEDRHDVDDDGEGGIHPNKEMRMSSMIAEAI